MPLTINALKTCCVITHCFDEKLSFFFYYTCSKFSAVQARHSGTSVRETSNKVGSIGGIGYELWADSGNNSATFYSDGSFSCSFQMQRIIYVVLVFLSTVLKRIHKSDICMLTLNSSNKNISNVDYSFVGIYGWSRSPLVEFYVVDNWLSPYRPGDWVGNVKKGDYTIDGAVYTVYQNTRTGPSIDGNTTFKQYFSVRRMLVIVVRLYYSTLPTMGKAWMTLVYIGNGSNATNNNNTTIQQQQ
ncbi:concanavalin A-like lectin/glucanase [Piromyces finnis]|uniref:Endo-1,4-beta-xylanase n=1 Tax=Piromyces finnis TaxID=1754191 RepID=A0A1Y1UHD9_9FUNG|nr:concanavalin A-like lectin/glucanase [Piromyces finnis]|eukprot:ORX37468.1 concanavalin A-like lectin/glucanase [Piromyces finnis]